MRVFDVIHTQEIKYGYDHKDRIMLDLHGYPCVYMKCLDHNYYQATNFIVECWDCGIWCYEFYIGKLHPYAWKAVGSRGGLHKSYTYGCKCDSCYDEVMNGVLQEEFYV